MANDTGLIPTQNQFPYRTLVACLTPTAPLHKHMLRTRAQETVATAHGLTTRDRGGRDWRGGGGVQKKAPGESKGSLLT